MTDTQNRYDEVGAIIAYESGTLDADETLTLFSHLVKNGHAWSLQGHYGRTASNLIKNGYLSDTGDILQDMD